MLHSIHIGTVAIFKLIRISKRRNWLVLEFARIKNFQFPVILLLLLCEGNIDAFSAGVKTNSGDVVNFSGGEIVIFDEVQLNIQKSYDPATGNLV